MHKGYTFVSNIYSLYYSRRVTDQKFGVNTIFLMNTFIHQGCFKLIKSGGKCIILIYCSFELSLKDITIENNYFIYILLLKKILLHVLSYHRLVIVLTYYCSFAGFDSSIVIICKLLFG